MTLLFWDLKQTMVPGPSTTKPRLPGRIREGLAPSLSAGHRYADCTLYLNSPLLCFRPFALSGMITIFHFLKHFLPDPLSLYGCSLWSHQGSPLSKSSSTPGRKTAGTAWALPFLTVLISPLLEGSNTVEAAGRSAVGPLS